MRLFSAGTFEEATSYWAEQFAPTPVDQAQEEAWSAHAAPPARDIPQISQEQIALSSPGPDGITYMVWSKVGALAEEVLWGVTQALMAGEPAPGWRNVALMVRFAILYTLGPSR